MSVATLAAEARRTDDRRARARVLGQAWKPAVLVLYAAWALVVGAHHEPWFDEAQAWLLARDSTLWQLFVERVRYEGSPGLWHLVLWIAIRAGLPYAQLHLLSTAFAIAGAAVVLWRAPFPPLLRVAIVCSYFFAFQFAVIARSYALDLLFVPLLACWFSTRVERPLRYAAMVGLVANANAHGFLAAAVLGVELAWRLVAARAWRRADAWVALALAGGAGLIALATTWQPADNAFLKPENAVPPAKAMIGYLRNAFVDRGLLFGRHDAKPLDVIAGYLLSGVLIAPSVALIRRGAHRLLALALLAGLAGFSALTYASPWHSGILFLCWVMLLWVSWSTPVSARLRTLTIAGTAAICAWQGVQAVRTGLWDMTHVYSPAKDVADAIVDYRATHPGARVAAFGYKSFSIQPWLPANAFANYHDGAPTPSYIEWKKAEPWQPEATPVTWQHALDTRADLVLASLTDIRGQLAPLLPQACRAGYRVERVFRGAMPWRGVVSWDDTLVLFERTTPPQRC